MRVGGAARCEGRRGCGHGLRLLGAANRDEAQFPDAAAVRLDRANGNSHFAFGSGIHFCAGVALARMELELSAETLLRRMGNIRLTPGAPRLRHMPNSTNRGLENIRLSFERLDS